MDPLTFAASARVSHKKIPATVLVLPGLEILEKSQLDKEEGEDIKRSDKTPKKICGQQVFGDRSNKDLPVSIEDRCKTPQTDARPEQVVLVNPMA